MNPFFGKWHTLATLPSDLSCYSFVVDTVAGEVYEHPMITEINITRPADYYTEIPTTEKRFTFAALKQHLHSTLEKSPRITHVNTCDRPFLVLTHSSIEDHQAIADIAYRVYAHRTAPFAKAIRPVEDSDRQIHWVWFRKPGYRLREEIVLRAASWIELCGPRYTYHLWSSLADAAELTEFLADLRPEVKARYFDSGAITVHYAAEFRTNIFDWLAMHTPDIVPLFQTIWDSPERQDIVMKTDYTRNILLAIHGGIYTDFNDLVCLAPIEPLLETHAGCYVGVTDNTTLNNASNYFMYAAKGNPGWLEITKRCTATIPDVYNYIYRPDALALAREIVRMLANGQNPDMDQYSSMIEPEMRPNFLQAAIYAAELTVNEKIGAEISQRLAALKRDRRRGRNVPMDYSSVLSPYKGTILDVVDTEAFAKSWRFSRTDMCVLNYIMQRSNLPIFCRQQRIELFYVPFSYLLRYSCLLSYVGHLGDGSSYGMNTRNGVTMVGLLKK